MLCLATLLSPALNLRLPHAPAIRPAVAASRTSSLVLMAKKKQKGKAPKGASASLAALDAWEANLGSGGGGGDDAMAPVVFKKGKNVLKKAQLEEAAEAAADLDAPMEAGMAPVAAAPAASAAAAVPVATLADKVRRITQELGLDESLPLAPAVKACVDTHARSSSCGRGIPVAGATLGVPSCMGPPGVP